MARPLQRAVSAAAAAACALDTSRFGSNELLMGTYDKHVKINKDADKMTVRVQHAVLRGESRDFVLGSVKCILSLELLKDMPLAAEDDVQFFKQAPLDEAEAAKDRERREAQFFRDMMMREQESSGGSSSMSGGSAESEDDPFGLMLRAAEAADTGATTATATAGGDDSTEAVMASAAERSLTATAYSGASVATDAGSGAGQALQAEAALTCMSAIVIVLTTCLTT
jgi:hypothetical protein